MEGLTDIKLEQLCNIMRSRSLGLICLQETRVPHSGSRELDNGYILITAGEDDEKRTYAGVGFLIAPRLKKSLYSFKPISERICRLKLRVKGGKTVIINAYAPHNGYDFQVRQQYFSQLSEVVANSSSFGLKLVVGDLNARIHNNIGGEREVFGQYCFGDPRYNPEQHPDSNRELLIEHCMAGGMCVANTYFNHDAEQQATFHDIWQNPVAEVSHKGFAQLDLVLCPREQLWQVKQVRSDRWQALATHHFLVEVCLEFTGTSQHDVPALTQRPRYDLTALKQVETKEQFAVRVRELECESFVSDSNCDHLVDKFCQTLHMAASETIPDKGVRARRPWIQEKTLELIASRNDARKRRDRTMEVSLNSDIRRSARLDRVRWMERIINSGSWSEIKRLKKLRKVKLDGRRLNNSQGVQVDSRERADTFAAHLETVQWAVRPMNSFEERPPIDAPLPICTQTISLEELKKAVRQMKNNRASVQVPAEMLKALCDAGAIDADCWLLKIMRLCWDTKTTPAAWHIAQVIPVYKKGDPANCDNYRPISLLSVLYKLYASILLNRLKSAGAERRLWDSQFGFRSRRSTEDALFIARRRIEQAWASRDGHCFLLALDWRKAFDSIAPDRMLWALRRYGLNEPMLAAIKEIYTDRTFRVVDAGQESSNRLQLAGISQGCPLSPFLCVKVMTILMVDARDILSERAKKAWDNDDLADALFADDTLLISRSGRDLEEYMAAIEKKGSDYGLQIHWGKVHLVPVRTADPVQTPRGEFLPAGESMVYLGSTLHASGKFGCEMSRKIGAARAEFDALKIVWKSPVLAKARKLHLFEMLLGSKMRYGTASAWLSKSDMRRIDGFQARCLRILLGIPPSFISRVSNEAVRSLAGQRPWSVNIRKAQFELLDKVMNDPNKQVLRDAVFRRGSSTPITQSFSRKVGRPRHNWFDQLLGLLHKAADA